MRLIDADALLSQVKRSGEKNPYTGAMLGTLNAVYDFVHRDVLNLINYAPTIDAEPVRHGRYDESGDCTVCGYPMPTDDRCDAIFPQEIKYCYNCGAKMDEKVQQ